MNPLGYTLAALILAAAVILVMLGGCTSRPARVTDDLGRVWEQCGDNVWCLKSQPAALDNPIFVPAQGEAF